MVELDDIQSGVLFPRPTPYAATYLLFRIDEREGGAMRIRPRAGAPARTRTRAGAPSR